MRVIAAFAALLISCAAAWAQDKPSSWQEAFETAATAMNDGDFNSAVDQFRIAQLESSIPFEQAIALNGAANALMALGRVNEAEAAVDAALALLTEDSFEEIQLASALTMAKASIVFQTRGQEAMRPIGEEYYRLISLLPRPGWRSEADGGAIHQFSGFACPTSVAGFPSSDTHAYNQNGTDVSCRFERDEDLFATVYFTYLPGPTRRDLLDQSEIEILARFSDANVVSDNRSDLIVDGRSTETLSRTYQADSDTMTGTWIALTNDQWFVKVRVTWKANYGDDAVQALVGSLVSETTSNIWIDDCDSVDSEDASDVGATRPYAKVAGVALESLLDDEQGPSGLVSAKSSNACILNPQFGSGREFIARRILDDGPVSHVAGFLNGTLLEPEVIAFRSSTSSDSNTYVAIRKGVTWHVTDVFESPLSNSQFESSIGAAFSGAEAIVQVSPGDDSE